MIGLFRRIYERKTMRIGVFGLTPGCGTTHLALSIANYYASKERLSVLYLESGGAGVIGLRTKNSVSVGGISGFMRDGVCYMPSCSAEDVQRLLAERYDIIVAEVSGWPDEFALKTGMFDRRVFMFSAKPWKYPAMQMTMKQMISQSKNIVQGDYCGFGLTKPEEKMVAAEFRLSCVRIPFIGDPFQLKKEDLRFLKEFLEKGR